MQALAFGLTVISEFGEFSVHRLVGAADDGAPKRRGRVIGHIAVWIMGEKLQTAEYSDQPIEPDKKARLLVAFTDCGIRRQLVRVYSPLGRVQRSISLSLRNSSRPPASKIAIATAVIVRRVMAQHLANGFKIGRNRIELFSLSKLWMVGLHQVLAGIGGLRHERR